MKRWVDVDPLDWFYRDTLEATRLKKSGSSLEGDVISGMSYNVFEKGKERLVKRFVTIDSQQEFLVPEYTYDIENPIYVLVNGVEVVPEKIETGKITMSNPMTAGIEVVVIAYGKPDYRREGCLDSPYQGCSDDKLPSADLKRKSTYRFSLSNAPETCTVLGTKLKRLLVTLKAGESADDAISKAVGFRRDVFVIHKGRLYLPYMYEGFPAVVGYNATVNGVNKRIHETVVVESDCILLNDRFFPKVRMRRAEFMMFMYRILENIHNRFTDNTLTINTLPQRHIADVSSWNSRWYAAALKSLLEEKFHDGCYVFPLYADDKFEPEECMTRAEAATYLNRLIEWVTEKYR